MVNNLKKFLQNKNTVTVVGVVLAIVVLYVAYNMRVNSAIKPMISSRLFAISTLPA